MKAKLCAGNQYENSASMHKPLYQLTFNPLQTAITTATRMFIITVNTTYKLPRPSDHLFPFCNRPAVASFMQTSAVRCVSLYDVGIGYKS